LGSFWDLVAGYQIEEPLNEKKFIEIEGKGKSARIKISPNGENILKFLPK